MSFKYRLIKSIIGFVYLVLATCALLGVLLAIFIYMPPPCHEKEALEKADSVTNSEWAAIFEESKELLVGGYRHNYNLESLPPTIASLQPVSVTSHGSTLWVYLATCGLDSKVIVFVSTSEEREQKISIGWGDPPESKIVWQKPNKNRQQEAADAAPLL